MARPEPTPAPLADEELFRLRWKRGQRDLAGPLARLYPDHGGAELLERLRQLLQAAWEARPAALRALDLRRDLDPDWFLSQEMVGYVFYVDRLAGTLPELPERLPYLQTLGVTYAHMMPCLKPRPGESDGGYAVMDYREIDPRLGTMADFEAVTARMRAAGISPVIDMVLNHTAAEHAWADAARAGDPHFRDFYLTFPDRELPDRYEADLLEVFPAQAAGNFTWDEAMGRWVWTTFNTWQWDLNWSNPEVFLAVLETVLFLANRGVEVFRLDAVAFMWKRMGTQCQNLPEVHDLLQLLTQSTRIAAPGVIHKAEAIVAPDRLVPYLGVGPKAGRVSNLAYHNSLMVQFWSALAARDTRLMTHVLRTHFPESFRRAAFATYIRCHDDIGWAITDEDAAAVPGTTGFGHRRFLADFYNGSFPGSFARGADFQSNPETGDRRTNGTLASLAGLEDALERADPGATEAAIRRILLGHALIAGFGGLPLIYMGDEIGLTNDRSYADDPDHAGDGRWMQRPAMDWDRTRGKGPQARAAQAILEGTKRILAARKATPQLASDVPTRVREGFDPGLLVVERPADDRPMLLLYSFVPDPRDLAPWTLGLDAALDYEDVLAGNPLATERGMVRVPGYGALWLRPGRRRQVRA